MEHFLVDAEDEPAVIRTLEAAGYSVEPSSSPVAKYEVVR